MPIYIGISSRVTIAISEFTALMNEVTYKRAFTLGAEGEAYQKIIDTLIANIQVLNGGYITITEYLLTLTGMSNNVQSEINKIF